MTIITTNKMWSCVCEEYQWLTITGSCLPLKVPWRCLEGAPSPSLPPLQVSAHIFSPLWTSSSKSSWKFKPICLRILVNSSLLHGAQSFTCQESCWGAEIRTRAVGSRTALSSTYVHFAHLCPRFRSGWCCWYELLTKHGLNEKEPP